MKYILTSALALSLLSGTAVMAQPDTQLRMSQNNYGDQQDNSRQDRRDRRAADQKASDEATADQKAADQKAADKAAADLKAAQRKAAGKAATTRRTNIDTTADQQINKQRATDQKNRDTRADQERVRDKEVDDRRTNDQREMDQRRIDQRSGDWSRSDARRRWSRGDRLPDQYRQDRYYVNDWQQYGLNRPPRGYRWVRDDNNDFFLAAIATGIISMVIYRDDRDQRWQRRYSRTYSYNDDIYYRECRNSPDPAGVIVGALIGGLLGHTASGGRTGATVAGVVVGGALGAALTSNLDCEDRSYAYKTYYDGFNAGRAYRNYSWRNPSNNHRGTFRVGRYYNDPDGFRCATYSQTVYIGSQRHRASGNACRQPDGTWAIVN